MTTKDFQKRSPLFIFLSYFGNHKKLFAADMLCACLIAGVDLTFPLVTRSALYDMLPGQMYKTFFLVMGAVVLSYILRSVLNFIVAYYGHIFGVRVEADIRRDLFRHMQTLSFDFYDRNRTGKLMSRGLGHLCADHHRSADRNGLRPMAAGHCGSADDSRFSHYCDVYAQTDESCLRRCQRDHRPHQSGD